MKWEQINYSNFFYTATGYKPYPYQLSFVERDKLPTFVSIPTGLGKTATVVLGWLWKYCQNQSETPRRLVYCLPTRVLVEQVYAEIQHWLKQLKLEIPVYTLMGGAIAQNWDFEPDKPTILIGTQDQLLSRALHRGYAMSPYRWTVQFAQLNNDALWVLDETQLMGIAPLTAAQLQGLRDKWHTYGKTHTIWMSATLDPQSVQTPDFSPTDNAILTLTNDDYKNEYICQRLNAVKHLKQLNFLNENVSAETYLEDLAAHIEKIHEKNTVTLVICNQVARSQAIYEAVKKKLGDNFSEQIILIHSRFRPCEREKQLKLIQQIANNKLTGIIIATQTVEAGLDICAKKLITELAPWYVLIQRFGRLNRDGRYKDSMAYWIDIDTKKESLSLPYKPEELDFSREKLKSLRSVNTKTIQKIENSNLATPLGLIPRKKDLLELFNTDPDLDGFHTDVSAFIRSDKERDVYVAWRDWEEEQPDEATGALQQIELCPIPIGQLHKFLKNYKDKNNAKTWTYYNGWQVTHSFYPGQRILLHCNVGGYDEELGFTGNSEHKPTPALTDQTEKIFIDADDQDVFSQTKWESLSEHSKKTQEMAKELCKTLLINDESTTATVEQSSLWHDIGKAHPEFQKFLLNGQSPPEPNTIWAKSAPHAERYRWNDRRGFRHELVSALIALAQCPDNFLLAYLIACHHGKVRTQLQPRAHELNMPYYQLFGVRDDDEIPEIIIDNKIIPSQSISLNATRLTACPSWAEQCHSLLQKYGIFRLAFLEMLVRVADWRASQSPKPPD